MDLELQSAEIVSNRNPILSNNLQVALCPEDMQRQSIPLSNSSPHIATHSSGDLPLSNRFEALMGEQHALAAHKEISLEIVLVPDKQGDSSIIHQGCPHVHQVLSSNSLNTHSIEPNPMDIESSKKRLAAHPLNRKDNAGQLDDLSPGSLILADKTLKKALYSIPPSKIAVINKAWEEKMASLAAEASISMDKKQKVGEERRTRSKLKGFKV